MTYRQTGNDKDIDKGSLELFNDAGTAPRLSRALQTSTWLSALCIDADLPIPISVCRMT
jgi:hypothetical protein